MKNSKKIIGGVIGIIVIVIIVVAIAINSGMIEKTPSAVKNTVIGEVYGNKITVNQLEENEDMKNIYSVIEQQVSGNPMNNAQAKQEIIQQRENVLNQMEVDAIVNKQVETLKLIPTQADMDKLVAEQQKAAEETLAKNGMTIPIYLQLKGITQEQFNAQLQQQARTQAVINYISKDINITDNDAQIYYNENKDSKFTVQPGADVYQIVVGSKAEAEKLKAQYESEINGKNLTTAQKLEAFRKIASANNIDSTKETGGSLGYIPFDYTQFNENFMNAFKALKNNGDVSGIVDSSNSSTQAYNVIFVDGIQTKATVTPFDDVKAQIIENLKQQKVNQQSQLDLDKWKKEANAKVYTDRLDYPILDKTSTNESQSGQTPTTEQPAQTPATTQTK